MVRNIVGTMIALSEEKISIKEFNDLFNNPLIGKSK
jgi:tRNA U38,U39,U40 pseudouridine synthase TruA